MPTSKVTDDALLAAAAGARHLSDLLTAVGLVACGGNYAIVRGRLERLGALDQRFVARGRRPATATARLPVSDEWLRAASARARRRKDILVEAGLDVGQRNYRLLDASLRHLGLDKGQLASWRPGTAVAGPPRYRLPLEQVLVKGKAVSGPALARRLVAAGLLVDWCDWCEGTTWLGGPIPLELDHVNGDRTDNRLENLRLLCPNCHALTDTYRGRNVARRRAAA